MSAGQTMSAGLQDMSKTLFEMFILQTMFAGVIP